MIPDVALNYFWHPSGNPSPVPTFNPRDIRPSDTLSISFGQPGLPAHKRQALVNAWGEALPALDDVRLLWLTSKVPQSLFDAACRMPRLEGLWIKWSSIKSIAAISGLTSLKYFHLGSSTQLESVEPLRGCAGLEWLGLENLAKVRRLDPLADLHRLEGLYLEGSMWSRWTVATLSPVGGLSGLRYLSIANLKTDDQTLRPLFELRNLETLTTAKWWDERELVELGRLNPRLGR